LTIALETSILNITLWAGAAERVAGDSSAPDPQWLIDYYKEVVMADEKKFLDRDAAEWFKRVEPGTVEGDKKVIIESGKRLIEIPETVMGVWREYERRGEGEK
jgi:hypothetical protein